MENNPEFKLRAESESGGHIRSVGEYAPGILGITQKEAQGRLYWMIRQDNRELSEVKQLIDTDAGKVNVHKEHIPDGGEKEGFILVEASEVAAACMDFNTALGVWMSLMSVLVDRANECAATGNSDHTIRAAYPLIDETEEAFLEQGFLTGDD